MMALAMGRKAFLRRARMMRSRPCTAASAPEVLWGPSAELCTLSQLREARQRLRGTKEVIHTPLVPLLAPVGTDVGTVFLKLDNLQTTGSFKIRGIMYKLLQSDIADLRRTGMFTFSAGNAGRAVAYLGHRHGIPTKIIMPDTVPNERRLLLESMGAVVEQVPSKELLDAAAACLKSDGRMLIHPFDDLDLIRGHGSCGLEVLEDCPDVDVLVICCGGGGYAAGVSAAVKLSGSKARVIAVEPTGAQSMYISFQKGAQSWCPGGKVDTICYGLAPPFAGKATFRHCQEFVDEVVLVTDDEVRNAVRLLFQHGHLVEASGAAAVAAVLAGKCGDLAGKKVVCTLSGRNISPHELASFFDD